MSARQPKALKADTGNVYMGSDPLRDPSVDLNEYMILAMLGGYLKSNPETAAFELAPFRVLQCVTKVCDSRGIFSGKGQKDYDCNMMESIGCLFVLCMYLATIPTIDSSEALFESAAVVYTALSDSLVMLLTAEHSESAGSGHGDTRAGSLHESIELMHPKNLLPPFYVNRSPILAFRDSLKTARNILREVARCIRESREPPNVKKQQKARTKAPTECWQPHSIYFMCCFAACHLSGVLKDLGNLAAVPGTMESVVLAASLVFKKKKEAHHPAEQGPPDKPTNAYLKVHKEEEESRFELCLELAFKMGQCMVNYTFDERVMQELRIARSHMLKKLAHADAEYARLACSDFRISFLGLAQGGSKTKPAITFGGLQSDTGYPARNLLLTGHQMPQWILKNPFVSATDLNEYEKKSLGGTPKTSTATTTVTAATLCYAEEREAKLFWNSLAKVLRTCYCSSRPLRTQVSVRGYFRSDYQPPLINGVGAKSFDFYGESLTGKQLAVAASDVESLCYHSDATNGNCAAQNNLSRGVYWACLSLIEWLSQETSAGRGFHQSTAALSHNLTRELRAGTSTLPSSSSGFGSPKLRPLNAGGGSGGSKPSLMEKLARAAKNARLEAQIDTLNVMQRSEKRFTGKDQRLAVVDRTLSHGIRILRHITTKKKHVLNELGRLREIEHGAPGEDEEEEENYDDEQEDEKVDVEYEDQHEHAGEHRIEGEEDDYDDGDGDGDGDDDDDSEDRDTGTETDAESRPGSHNTSRNEPSIALTEPDRKEKKQVAVSDEDPVIALLGSPMVREIGKFRRGLKLGGIIKPRNSRNVAESVHRVVSTVWSRGVEDDAADRLAASVSKQFRTEKASFEAQAKRIAEEVLRARKEREEELLDFRRAMEDSQEMEVSKTRAYKLSVLKNARETKKQDTLLAALLNKQKLEDEANLIKRGVAAKKALAKRREEENELEVARLLSIKRIDEGREKQENIERRERHAEELMRLKNMADSKEWNEILRRAKEEARMKYLEERRRYIEKKKWDDQNGARLDLERRRKEFLNERKKVQGRIRAGNFMRHGGKLGFYDDVRAAPVEWIQYEDASGTPYYYDPLLNKTTYEAPTDAPIRHYTVDERIDYDVQHGEGAYDLLKWNERNKESIINYGGYYEHDGSWVEVNGIYGEDGTFYDLNLGFFNEWGQYILRPIITERFIMV